MADDCYTCNGLGYDINSIINTPCESCNGTGRIRTKIILSTVCICGHDLNFHNILGDFACHEMTCNCKGFNNKKR